MPVKERKISGRKKILEVLSKHPQGLNSARIRQLIWKEYAIGAKTLTNELVRLTDEGKIMNVGKCGCPSCAMRSVIYKLGGSPPKQGEMNV